MSTAQCIGVNGGAFDEKQSNTWVTEPLSDDAVEDPLFSVDSSNNLGDEFGTDTLRLTDSTSVSRFPFHIPRFSDDSTVHRNNLGLGPESTLLSQLHKAGKIASRSWSLFWGLTGPTAQMDGNLILGGYDAAKVQGAEYTQPISRNCRMCEHCDLTCWCDQREWIGTDSYVPIGGGEQGSDDDDERTVVAQSDELFTV